MSSNTVPFYVLNQLITKCVLRSAYYRNFINVWALKKVEFFLTPFIVNDIIIFSPSSLNDLLSLNTELTI